MPYPQLPGHVTPTSNIRSSRHAIYVAIGAIALIIALPAWWLLPGNPPSTPPTTSGAEATCPPITSVMSTDHVLHLRHAESELATAAEQLVRAERLVVAMLPTLDRFYLQVERRRAEGTRSALNSAQRGLEQARAHINLVSHAEKE